RTGGPKGAKRSIVPDSALLKAASGRLRAFAFLRKAHPQRQVDAEGSSLVRHRMRLDAAAMTFDDLARQRQAQAGPSMFFAELHERIEDALQLVRRNAVAAVVHAQPQLVVGMIDLQRDFHAPARRRVP